MTDLAGAGNVPQTEPLRLTILVPAFNEADGLPALLDQLEERYGGDDQVEILVVDDGSDDDTAAVVGRRARFRLISHPYNKGNGAAVKTGLANARGRTMIIIDADGQHPPEDIDRLLSHLGTYDLVVGARSTESDSTAFRDFGNYVLAKFASHLVNFQIPDLTSGFRAFKVPLMRRFTHLYPNGFSFPSTSTMCFIISGYNVRFEPIVARRRETGSSKIKPFKDGRKFLGLMLRLTLLFNPTRFFFPVSVVCLLLGAGWAVRSYIVHHQGLSVASLLMILVALLVALLGAVAEQLSQIVRALNHPDR